MYIEDKYPFLSISLLTFYMDIADSFCFTQQWYGKMPRSELDAKTETEGSGGGGATLKPGIVRYDNTKFRMHFPGCQLIPLLLDNVHLEKERENKAARGDSKEHVMETN